MNKRKTKIIILLIFIILICIVYYSFVKIMPIMDTYDYNKSNNYTDSIIGKLKENQNIVVNDIFEFEFNRAYVIKETYADGESISKMYNLNIDNNKVKMPLNEFQKRIIFVDDKNKLKYDYRYDQSKLNITNTETTIIYPSTIIKNTETEIKGSYGVILIN